MNKIKNLLTKSVVLLPAFSLLVGLSVPMVSTSVYAADKSCDDFSIAGGANCSKGKDQQENLFGSQGIFTKIVNIMLFLIGSLSVIMLIYGGVQYVLSSGDAGKVTKAKNTILYAIVGIVVAILAYAIVNFVISNVSGEGSDNTIK